MRVRGKRRSGFCMIKFIATDLDGTLLDPRGVLPNEIFPLVARLSECGILFAPASGRQYANLKKLFFPVWEKTIFICENGALVRQGDKTLYLNALSAAPIKGILDAVRRTDGLFPILCGADNAYIENKEEPFRTRARGPYSNCIELQSLDEAIEREPVCKISVYNARSAQEQGMKVLPPFLEGLKLTLSGEHWCDISAATADKGEAVKEIQKQLGLAPDECMAFGDHMNDLGLLRACTHSRAVENAYPPVRAAAAGVVPSNAEYGVLKTIAALLREREKENIHV